MCPNCGSSAQQQYCPQCGQEQGDLVPTLRSWLSETVGELLFIEARLPRTLRALFFRPGYLTQEWWNGRKASFISPLRLYLLAAVPFFFVFFTASRVEERADPLEYLVGDLIFTAFERPEFLPPLAPLSPESLDDPTARAEWQEEFQRRQSHNDSITNAVNERITVGVQRVFGLLPAAVGLAMVPLLALIFAPRAEPRPRFIARLVLALHVHAVGFVVAVLGAPFGVGLSVGLGGSSLYLVAARRRLLHESWLEASFLGLCTAVVYVVVFFIAYIGFVISLVTLFPQWTSGST